MGKSSVCEAFPLPITPFLLKGHAVKNAASTLDFLSAPPTQDALPWHSEAALHAVLERVDTLRFTHFLTLQAELLSLHSDACAQSNFLSHATDIACMDSDACQQTINHPVFRAWTALTLHEMNALFNNKTTESQPLTDLLREFPRAIDRIRLDLAKGPAPTFYRLDLDPLLARALPPSYDMPVGSGAIATAKQAGHPLGFFKDVTRLALDRIKQSWPFAGAMVDALIASIAYLPDGNFRSCSASRYTGLVLLSSRDSSILDLEESIVHEAGHQLLYVMVEIEPVCLLTLGKTYQLPWSTQIRDLYGYFHAFFIYVILARYLEHVIALRTGDEVRRARDRLGQILRGLVIAVPDLLHNAGLTPFGRALMALLRREINAIADRHRELLG
jgi:hypothetical protein